MNKTILVSVILTAILAGTLGAFTEQNCMAICAGAFCQDSAGNPSIASPDFPSDSSLVKYSTGYPALTNRFGGDAVFCGAFNIPGCIVPNACLQTGGGGGGGGPTPVCASFNFRIIAGPQENGPSPDFWGYNWTQEFVNNGGGIPSRLIGVDCKDSQGNLIGCPQAPTFSTSIGTLVSDPVSNSPTTRIWQSANTPGSVTISASMSTCGGGTKTTAFKLHILNACTIQPENAHAQIDRNVTYSATCGDETGNPRPCYYPLGVRAEPEGLGTVTAFCPPNSQCESLWSQPHGDASVAQFWLDSQVNFTPARDGTGFITGGGPTFFCRTPVTIGNPATACTLALSQTEIQTGKTMQARPSCTGALGPTECPDVTFWANGPSAFISWQNQTEANVTAGPSGSATITAGTIPGPITTPFSCTASLDILPGVCTTPPIVRTFGEDSTRFESIALDQLERVQNLVLARPDARIRYGTEINACGQDFDGGIRTSPGFLAVDSGRFHNTISQPITPVAVTLRNVPGTQAPRIFVLDEFADRPSSVIQRGADCATLNRCTNTQFDAQAHTVTFLASGFSSFAAESATDPVSLVDDAQFMTQTPPPQSMTPGQIAQVAITMRNNGTTMWTDCTETACGVYRIHLAKSGDVILPADPAYNTWGINPVFTSPSESIAPGSAKTFYFQVTAPDTEGTYTFQWRMARQENGFGQATLPITVQVSAMAPSPTPSPSPEPSPTPTASPTASPTATPSITPTATIGPVSRPAAYVQLSCPIKLVVASKVALGTQSASFGQTACNPAVVLNVTSPRGDTLETKIIQECTSGQTIFAVNTTQDGTYRVAADYNGSTDSCIFAVTGTPPQATPEMHPLIILFLGLAVGAIVYRKK